MEGAALPVEQQDRTGRAGHESFEGGEQGRQDLGERCGPGDELEHLGLPVEHLLRVIQPQGGLAHPRSLSW